MAHRSGRRNFCGVFVTKNPLRLVRTIAIVFTHSEQDAERAHGPHGETGKQGLASGCIRRLEEARMVQTTNRFFDEVARLMNDAAGVAQGVRREFETLFRNQAERFLRDLDVVKREEFEAVKDMARIAREENEALKVRMAALEGTVKELANQAAKEPAREAAKETPPAATEAVPTSEPGSDAGSPNVDRPPG
jgi:BMFP domain-containing protein YqiC